MLVMYFFSVCLLFSLGLDIFCCTLSSNLSVDSSCKWGQYLLLLLLLLLIIIIIIIIIIIKGKAVSAYVWGSAAVAALILRA